MAVIQISKIQVRRGLQENLPQLASGELGWSIDERRLFIGNGTLVEGAPATGITEILTEYSNVALGSSGSITASNLLVRSETLIDNTTATVSNVSIATTTSRIIDYNIIRSGNTRVGSIKVTNLGGSAVFEDEYTETEDLGVTLTFTADSSNVVMSYTTTSTSANAAFNYYLKTFA
jgi:hypothetical protein